MQIEFGNSDNSSSILRENESLNMQNTYYTLNDSWNSWIAFEIPNMQSPKGIFVHKIFFSGTKPADQYYFINGLSITNTDAYPKTIHIQKVIDNLCAWVVHPFVLLPNVSISIKFPTVAEDLGKVGMSTTSLKDSCSGNLLIIATPVFLAGEATGTSTLGYKEPTRRVFYNRLFDYSNDLVNLNNMSFTQNAVFYKKETLYLKTVPDLCYHNANISYGSTARSNLFNNENFASVDKSPFETVPAGVNNNKSIALPNRCTKQALRNTMILEFILPAPNTLNTKIIASAYTREGNTSMYSRNTVVTQNAGALGAPRGTLLIPCSYRPDYHSKIARIITKITM